MVGITLRGEADVRGIVLRAGNMVGIVLKAGGGVVVGIILAGPGLCCCWSSVAFCPRSCTLLCCCCRCPLIGGVRLRGRGREEEGDLLRSPAAPGTMVVFLLLTPVLMPHGWK